MERADLSATLDQGDDCPLIGGLAALEIGRSALGHGGRDFDRAEICLVRFNNLASAAH